MDAREELFRIKKILFICFLVVLNGVMIFLLTYFDNNWVQYIIVVPVLSQLFYATFQILLIVSFYIGKKIKNIGKQTQLISLENKCLAMIIPCYNEQEEQLKNTINAYLKQKNVQKLKKMMFVIVDGKVKTKNQKLTSNPKNSFFVPESNLTVPTSLTIPTAQEIINGQISQKSSTNPITTNLILKKIFKKSISQSTFFQRSYVCWKKKWLGVQLYNGVYEGLPYVVIVKDENCSKRDSLALVYKMLYHLSGEQPLDKNNYDIGFMNHIEQLCKKNGITKFDYMITTDADSQPCQNSAYNLIRQVERKKKIFGATGQVQVRFSDEKCNLLQMTQYEEYISGQSIVRLQQKLTSEKITCLPGSLNVIRICKETCGKSVLDEYRFKSDTDSLKEYIKNSASQDRHHIMIMFSLYSQVKTSMVYDAIVRTSVPLTLKHFFSQRKRWNLGTITHNYWMTFKIPNIPMWQRISSFMIILQFIILPTLMYSYARFILMLKRYDTGQYSHMSAYFIVMLALAAFRLLFMIGTGILTPGLQLKHRILYLVMLLPFIFILNPIKAIACFLYNIFHVDDFNWIRGEQLLTSKITSVKTDMLSQTDKSVYLSNSEAQIKKNDFI